MKPGSIVVCLKVGVDPTFNGHIKWLPVMDEETPYMIRDMQPSNNADTPAVTFEEGTIGMIQGIEIGFPAEYVREILPPEDIRIEDLIEDKILA